MEEGFLKITAAHLKIPRNKQWWKTTVSFHGFTTEYKLKSNHLSISRAPGSHMMMTQIIQIYIYTHTKTYTHRESGMYEAQYFFGSAVVALHLKTRSLILSFHYSFFSPPEPAILLASKLLQSLALQFA